MDQRISQSLIRPADEGAFLLQWLCARFLYCDETRWRSYIESGSITLNGLQAAAETILHGGDILSFAPLDLVEPEVSVDYAIIYEDDDYLVVDKPALLPCHPGGRFFKHTLWYLLREKYPALHFASRLDRETSGLLLVCLSPRATKHISAQQGLGLITKEYRVIVHGHFPASLGAHGFLVQDQESVLRKKRKFVYDKVNGEDTGKQEYAETDFTFLSGIEHAGGVLSLLSARLGTGRTHQIRATLSSLGYPVCGDKIYGLDESLFLRFIAGTLGKADRIRLMSPCQALQSYRLSFASHDGRALEFTVAQSISLLQVCKNADILRGEIS